MADNTHKEKWINEVFNSTRGMQHATPADGLFGRVMAANATAPAAKVVPFPAKQWAAAAIILLALNIGSVIYFSQRENTAHTNQNPFAAALQMESTYDY